MWPVRSNRWNRARGRASFAPAKWRTGSTASSAPHITSIGTSRSRTSRRSFARHSGRMPRQLPRAARVSSRTSALPGCRASSRANRTRSGVTSDWSKKMLRVSRSALARLGVRRRLPMPGTASTRRIAPTSRPNPALSTRTSAATRSGCSAVICRATAPPRELPIRRTGRVSPTASRNPSIEAARVSRSMRGTRSEPPKPGRSTRYTVCRRASSSRTSAQSSRLRLMPCSSRAGGPLPATSNRMFRPATVTSVGPGIRSTMLSPGLSFFSIGPFSTGPSLPRDSASPSMRPTHGNPATVIVPAEPPKWPWPAGPRRVAMAAASRSGSGRILREVNDRVDRFDEGPDRPDETAPRAHVAPSRDGRCSSSPGVRPVSSSRMGR